MSAGGARRPRSWSSTTLAPMMWESAAATAAHHLRQREHEAWQERQALAATLHSARLAGVSEYRLVQVTGLSRQRVHTLIGEGAALSDCP